MSLKEYVINEKKKNKDSVYYKISTNEYYKKKRDELLCAIEKYIKKNINNISDKLEFDAHEDIISLYRWIAYEIKHDKVDYIFKYEYYESCKCDEYEDTCCSKCMYGGERLIIKIE